MQKAVFYDCLKKIHILWNDKLLKNMKQVSNRRNTTKIIKVFMNWKNIWYLKLDKKNRNLHIETKNKNEDINLFTDY